MKTKLVTALFDINRENLGDGRKLSDYESWLKRTLKIKSDMVIYTEEKFLDLINSIIENCEHKIEIVLEKFTQTPFYSYNDKIKEILKLESYKNKMRDIKRIECYLSEYNVIQYSKFGWLKNEIEKNNNNYDFYFWVDSGISRFFDENDLSENWPNTKKLDKNKITIQANSDFTSKFPFIQQIDYIWDNNCIFSGGIFGGGKEAILKLYVEIFKKVEFMLENDCFNNEQISLALVAKEHPYLFDVFLKQNDSPMPIIKMIK